MFQISCTSLANAFAIERKYDTPKIKNKTRIIGSGIKTIVQAGVNSKTGINPKKTPTSTNAKIPIATVATTGKNSFFVFKDLMIPALLVKLPSPPDVPLRNKW